MWIVPSNHKQFSAFAQGCVASKQELNLLSDQLPLRLMWRSKPSSFSTWSGRWNKVWWMQHLYGLILKPSHQNSFTTKYTASLVDIRVNLSVLPENLLVQKTQDTCGHTLNNLSNTSSQNGASLKTCPTTLMSDTVKCDKAWKKWVIQLRKEYSQRKKLVHRISGKDFSSLPWPTPTVMNTRENMPIQDLIALQAELKVKHKNGNGFGFNLHQVVRIWGTPSARDWKDTPGMSAQRKDGKSRIDQLPRQVSLWAKDMNNMNGKRREQLNPAWVAQLMGTTLEQTFFGCMEMELFIKQVLGPSEIC